MEQYISIYGWLFACIRRPSFVIPYRICKWRKKVLYGLNTGKVDRIPSSKAILAECVQTTMGEYALRFTLNLCFS